MRSYNRTKITKLIMAIIIDLIGLSSFVVPALGESMDIVWGPISGMMILFLFPNYKKFALLGAIEEALPFTDFIPTAYIAWRQEYA